MDSGYIETCIINQNVVNIITINGYQMLCKIIEEEEDCFIVVVSNDKKKLIFKHAISTIEPANPRVKA